MDDQHTKKKEKARTSPQTHHRARSTAWNSCNKSLRRHNKRPVPRHTFDKALPGIWRLRPFSVPFYPVLRKATPSNEDAQIRSSVVVRMRRDYQLVRRSHKNRHIDFI